MNGPDFLAQKSCANGGLVFVRMEEALTGRRSFRLAAHFAWNSQAFSERAYRLVGVSLLRLLRPAVSFGSRKDAARVYPWALRGMSRDRLDLLGEEYFQYVLRPRLRSEGLKLVENLQKEGHQVVPITFELEHVARPLAEHLGLRHIVCNRLEFRDDLATGRLLNPVVPLPDFRAEIEAPGSGNWRLSDSDLRQELQIDGESPFLVPTERWVRSRKLPAVSFGSAQGRLEALSVRQALSGKSLLIIGTTGFIGKVLLSILLEELPTAGRIILLIRRQGSRTALQRFEKFVAESPVFKALHEKYGEGLGDFLAERIEVLEGDVAEPQLGLDAATVNRLRDRLDLIINSSGLTDFNPDLRLAMATNVDCAVHLVDFLRSCSKAGLIHVSTCFVNGRTEGRVAEEIQPNYTPKGSKNFDARQEWQLLHETIARLEREAEGEELSKSFHAEALARSTRHSEGARDLRALEQLARKIRGRWVRDRLIEIGIERAAQWGWPNIYTYTKSLGESLLALNGEGLPIAIVRPSIVESSLTQPFRGWNEGVNTTAPLSYLLGTYFRQLPSNKRKRLDVIPVDLVCRGITLVAAAVVLRRYEKVYQLATSATNPSDMRRAIELTCLAHRKHYRSLEGLEHWLRSRFDTIPVSKQRYRNVSLPRFQRVLGWTDRVLSALALNRESLQRKQRALEKVQKVIELYEPFILDNEYYFAADHIKLLDRALVEDERDRFGYDSESIDWYDYWINLHVPALRRWTYPLIEGRRPETGLLPRNFKLPVRSELASNLSPVSDSEPLRNNLQHVVPGGS
ncbi:MAG: SDR family oxidoreductase [Acidobacteriota bacterium]